MYVLNFEEVPHNHEASYCNGNAVYLYPECIRFRSQVCCSAILTSFSILSLFYRGKLRNSGPTHKNLSTTIFLPLLGARNNFLILLKVGTFSGESLSLRIPRPNHSLNTTSGTKISPSSVSRNRRENNTC
jgi:hypothetical protein